jgi:hypothetical protein
MKRKIWLWIERNEWINFGCKEDNNYVVKVYVYNFKIMDCIKKLLGMKSEVNERKEGWMENGYMGK